MPVSRVSQSALDQVPSSVVRVTVATIDIEHPSELVGRSVSKAVDPTTVPVRSPEIDPSVSKIVQNPVTTDPVWNSVAVAVLVPADTLVNQPIHDPSSDSPDGPVGISCPSSSQPATSTASRTAPINRRRARLT